MSDVIEKKRPTAHITECGNVVWAEEAYDYFESLESERDALKARVEELTKALAEMTEDRDLWAGNHNEYHCPYEADLAREKESKNTAYSERDRLVCAISKIFPSRLERHPDSDTSWEDDWRWIVFVSFPTGQASWHIHDSELGWFDHLDRRDGNSWDGHSTTEKYARIERFKRIGDLGNELAREKERSASLLAELKRLDETACRELDKQKERNERLVEEALRGIR